MTEPATLASLMLALRLLSTVLAFAIVTWWTPSLYRVVRGLARERDAVRAIWVPLAIAVLIFQARWLYPGLADATRLRLWVAGQAGIAITLLAAIYHHGAGDERFDTRRTMIVHLAMMVLCFLVAAFIR